VRSTVHDLAHKTNDGGIEVGVEHTLVVDSYEENVRFPADEFSYTFPRGTAVTDYIVNLSYTKGNESPADLSQLERSAPVAAALAAGAPVRSRAGGAAVSMPPSGANPSVVVAQVGGRNRPLTTRTWWWGAAGAVAIVVAVVIVGSALRTRRRAVATGIGAPPRAAISPTL
jgi:hypothetical protein